MARARMTPSLQRRVQLGIENAVAAGNALDIRHCGSLHGAFMEPSGRNRSQPVANVMTPKTAQISRFATGGNPRQRFRSDGKEGVDGSSPSEGSRKTPR